MDCMDEVPKRSSNVSATKQQASVILVDNYLSKGKRRNKINLEMSQINKS